MKNMLNKLNGDMHETAFSVLGVALLLMLPRNILKVSYWLAVGSWAVADICSDNSRLSKLTDLV